MTRRLEQRSTCLQATKDLQPADWQLPSSEVHAATGTESKDFALLYGKGVFAANSAASDGWAMDPWESHVPLVPSCSVLAILCLAGWPFQINKYIYIHTHTNKQKFLRCSFLIHINEVKDLRTQNLTRFLVNCRVFAG